MGSFIDLTGIRFGRLTVLHKTILNQHGQWKWLCQCDCGKAIEVLGYHLRDEHTTSCGCAMKETSKRMGKANKKHGGSESRLYHIWQGMRQRCNNPNSKDYSNYGGRGIHVCKEWNDDFRAFRKWSILTGYLADTSLDRKNNNGNYEPRNCRWSTDVVQHNNTRANHFVTYDNESRTIAEWARLYGIPYSTLHRRLFKYKWGIERALTMPIGKEQRNTL